MLPGKTYKPEDALKILRKRYWFVLVPWAIVAAVTAATARKLPDLFEAHAVIQVVAPKVPASLVKAPQTALSLDQRLQAIEQTIRTRSRLERLIQEFDLYPEERKKQIMQDVIEGMEGDITIKQMKGDTFAVSYVGKNATTVRNVAEKLGSLFIEENARQSSQRADNTTSYVENQAEDARRKLEDTEQRLKDYQIQHAGEMPEQQMANIQAMQGLQNQLMQIAQQLNTDQANKLQLEKFIAEQEAATDTTPVSPVTAESTLPAAQQLLNAQNQLNLMLISKKPDNPEVQTMQRLVNGLKKTVAMQEGQQSVGSGAGESPFEAARRKKLAELHENLELVKTQIAGRQADEKIIRAKIDQYQARVNAVPVRSAELLSLLRDYGADQKAYGDLAAQRVAAKMAASLETKQLGEQFNLIDPARQPQKPYSPNRVVINIGGIFGGLGLGLLLVALMEYRDTTFKTDRELASVLTLPVLAVVPLMLSDAERRAQFRRRLIANVGLGSAVAVCAAVLAYTFLK